MHASFSKKYQINLIKISLKPAKIRTKLFNSKRALQSEQSIYCIRKSQQKLCLGEPKRF